VYIGSHGHDNLDDYNLILPSTTYLEKESTYMNFTGLIQKSGSLVSALPNIRNASDILNMFLIYLSKQGQADSLMKSGNSSSKSQTKILNNKNAMHSISGIDFHIGTLEKKSFNKSSPDIDKYFTSNEFSKSSKTMNAVQKMNDKSSYFSKN
tara:strand:+ start:967 stop:1422 length:456 start_codon:yes stop_codon:yes gene_type:complete